jgi:exopolysaccharide biosynthesis polyprenyl glycosylphosphotransferase
MASNSLINRHWVYVARHFLIDFVAVFVGILGGTAIRFRSPAPTLEIFASYLPVVVVACFTLPCCAYILGLYAPLRTEHAFAKRFGRLAACLSVTFLAIIAVGYIDWSARIGRGVMVNTALVLGTLSFLHHLFIYLIGKKYRESVAFIVNNEFDEREAHVFASFGRRHLHFCGIIVSDNYRPKPGLHVLGTMDQVESIVRNGGIQRVLCTSVGMNNPEMRRAFCQLRYSGTNVVSLIGLCEEIYQFVPLELVTPQWLLLASESPQILYIKKVKRAFDICCSLAGLVILGPIMLAGMLAIRLSSPGPVFYKQTRTGRFGRTFSLFKLRSMGVDAEKDGAQWSAAGNDPRATRVGRVLRKYRIDEIPQLFNVLRGEMSFVGPRPERPEFIEELAKEIPYFQERLLIQPGLTGWAQVNFPYGASLDDARRKLEYDLYYMKHMGLFLDIFILLDTISIVVRGGLGEKQKTEHPVSKAILEHFQDHFEKSMERSPELPLDYAATPRRNLP